MSLTCWFCHRGNAYLRNLPGQVIVRACDACHDEVIAIAVGNVPAVEVEREVSAAIDALSAVA